LLTDFGSSDAYVGVMKGVILSQAPQTRLVDLSHEVEPQATLEAAFLLQTAWRYFPATAVFVCVVDPGVGTARRRIALIADGRIFIGPDNGCLSAALPDEVRGARANAYAPLPVTLPPDLLAVSIENPTLFRRPLSATFEGRDVFAPVAAYVAAGGTLTDLGPRIDQMQAFPAFAAPRRSDGLDGLVLHIDTFGNLITDIRGADVTATTTFVTQGWRFPLVHTYGETKRPAAIVGSSGFVEIAVPNGNAALVLGAGIGDRVRAVP
jgi:S-adenosylmethionine hydrolase